MKWNGDRLKKLRKNKGLTQVELGKLIGKAMSTISGYEINNAEPDIDTIVVIANVLQTTTDYLLGVTEEQHLRMYHYDELPDKIKDTGVENLRIFQGLHIDELTLEELDDLMEVVKKIKYRTNKEKGKEK